MTEHRLVDQEDAPDDLEYEDIRPHERWTLSLDQHGDLMFNDTTKQFSTLSGEDAVKQSLNVSLGCVKGEDPLDPEFGMDIFRATRSFRHIEREIRRAIMHDDKDHSRVEAVTSVDITRLGRRRQARVNVEVKLDTGEVETLAINVGVPS